MIAAGLTLSEVEASPSRQGSLLAPGVVIGLPRASKRDLIMRELTAFRHRGRLGARIGFRFRGRLHHLPHIDRVSIVDWSKHNLVL